MDLGGDTPIGWAWTCQAPRVRTPDADSAGRLQPESLTRRPAGGVRVAGLVPGVVSVAADRLGVRERSRQHRQRGNHVRLLWPTGWQSGNCGADRRIKMMYPMPDPRLLELRQRPRCFG